MKDISQIEATSREEMVCPHCGKSKLKPLPIAAEKSSKKDKILYGTTCANPQCTKHGDRVDPTGLAKQYDSSRFDGLISKNSLFFIVILVVGGMVAAQTMGIFTLGTSASSVSGTIVGPDGEGISGATVIIGNETTTTNATGAYTLDIDSGSYEMVVLPPSNSSISGSPTYNVNINSDGTIEFPNSDNQTNKINLEDAYLFEAETKSSNASVFVKYKNPSNGGMTVVHVTGSKEDSETTKSEIELSTGTQNIQLTGEPTDQNIQLTSPISTTQREVEYTYTGSGESLRTKGNLPPKNVRVVFESGKKSTTETETTRVEGEETVPINIQSSEDEEVTAYLSEGSSQETETTTGVWTGTDPSITIDDESAPATVHVTLTGGIQTSTESTTGTVTDGEATFSIDGNIKAKNGIIEFSGGDATTTEIDSSSIYASGEDGTELRKTTIAEAPSDGEYVLDFSYIIDENPEYVDAGYMINGEKTEISEGDETISLNLEEGDLVEVWVESKNELSENNKQHTGDGSNNIEIVEYNAYPKEPTSGENINFEVTAENTGNEADDIDIVIYMDGKSIATEKMVLEAGETKTKTLGTSIKAPSDGVHTVSLNDLDTTIIRVDGASLEYGAGSVDATLSKKGNEGTIEVDTDGDGEFDCTVSAETGSCSLGQLNTGDHTIQVRESGVSNTDYTVNYTKREGPKDVTIDLDNDGNIDKTHDGLFTSDETISVSKTLESGDHTIDIETESGGGIEYEVEWSKAGVINSPTILIDGETVIDSSETFSGTKEFNLGDLTPGEHQVTFKSENGSYTAKLEWEEKPENAYPSVHVNSTEICDSNTVSSNGGYCNIPETHVSENMEFELGPEDTGEDFTVEYTEQSAPRSVTVESDSNTKTIQKSEGGISNGSWVYEASISILSKDDETISIEPNYINGFESELTGTIEYNEQEYGPKTPQVIVINPDGEKHIKNISSSELENGILNGSEKIKLPYNWFVEGENEIRVISKNGVPIETRIITRSTINQTVSFNGSN